MREEDYAPDELAKLRGGMTPAERAYSALCSEAADRVGKLALEHGLNCGCARCTWAMNQLAALDDNPPCPTCRGRGCSQCNYTGVH